MNKGYQNLHSHTNYCDGKLTAREMVEAVLRKGGGSIGFSEHSYISFEDELYSMTPEKAPLYLNDVNALKKEYADRIEVFLGIERDFFTESVPDGLDYVIGSVHFVEKDGKHITIDNSFEVLRQISDEHFGGDFLAVTEKYYATIADVAEKTSADIIGHFDIITKSNEGGKLFDETSPRYIKAALGAMEKILAQCKLFEINTGAMYRKGRSVQYPSEFLLRELNNRGGEIVITSDSHDGDSLYYKFEEMRELAKACGFKYNKRLTKDGFVDEVL